MALLYFATDGPNWLEQVDFLGNTSICEWSMSEELGVACNDEGSAVELNLGKTLLLDHCLRSICFCFGRLSRHNEGESMMWSILS